jgi:hypothetical protein
MNIEEKIIARVRAEQIWDTTARLEDFQLRGTPSGYILVNLKTGHRQFIFDDEPCSNDHWKYYSGMPLYTPAGPAPDAA